MNKVHGRNKLKVLVADDECAIADVLAIILRKSGYEAHTVHSGIEQVELAKLLHPDFVISDVVKPDMHGVDAAIEIKRTAPSCKILLFTGQKATLQLMEAGREKFGRFADLILPKPVHPQVILYWLRNGGNPCPADPVEEFRRLTAEQ
jgi:CheY-like chemotaxis protein